MAGTIKTFDELANPTTGLLADNNVKAISALDVRTIVTSNYQPQMVFHGTLWDMGSDPNEGAFRVLYYNPDFFEYQNPASPFNTNNIWQVTNGGSGMTNGTYNDVVITPSAPPATSGLTSPADVSNAVPAFGTKATVVVSGGTLTSLTITSPGTGWLNASANGLNFMTGTIEVPGGGTKPTLKFNGPTRCVSASGSTQIHRMTTNATAQGSQSQADFTLANTCIQGYSWISAAGNGVMMMSNSTYPQNYFKLQTDADKNLHVTFWRVAANV